MAAFGMRLVPFLEWLVRTSIQASILISLILLVKLLLRHRLSARFHYWLWVLLLIRLILPSAPQSRFSVFKLVPRGLTSQARRGAILSNRVIQEQRGYTETRSIAGIELAAGEMRTGKIVLLRAAARVAEGAARGRAPYHPGNSRITRTLNKRQATAIGALIWLAVAGGLGVSVVVRSFLVWRAIRGERPVTDPRVLDLLEDCKMEMGVQTLLCVIVSNRVRSPALLGYVRPRIVLPDGLLESVSLDELHDVFIHELAHLRRCDVYLGWVATLAQVVHWFNPLIWFACRQMWLDREMACDELAIASMESSEDADRYAHTLVNLAERYRLLELLPSVAALAENSYKIEKRIKRIAQAGERSCLSGGCGVMIVLLLSVLGLTDAPAQSVAGETLEVPSEYGTIQAAIDAAISGDKIEVAPGTYHEAINFNGKAVWLCGTGGAEVTTIDGGGVVYHVVQCVSGEGGGTRLEGFTITGGNAKGAASDNGGGGMYNSASSPTVINCIFAENEAAVYGGGMYNNNSNPDVNNCAFSANSACAGGGMSNYPYSSPTLANCTFAENTAYAGGGMHNHYCSSPSLTNCKFTGNHAHDNGGMINHSYSDAILTNCIFAGNSADNQVGGIHNADSHATLTNCTFIGNTAGVSYGGMRDRSGSNSTVTNCIFWNNTPDEIFVYESSPVITYCDVRGGWSGTGNIETDPMFADADGRLVAGSPCIDAGDNHAVPVDIVTDLDGNRRMADGDHNGSCDIDMGAYEVP